jgi:hypothetical protein
MKAKQIFISASILITLFFNQCKFEKDPGIFTVNSTIEGKVFDMDSHESLPGAMIKIWVNNDSKLDTIFSYTDEYGFFKTEKLNINNDLRINMEASKKPDYESTIFNGQDFYAVNTPGEITGGANADTWTVNFGLSPIVIAYQIIPDTLHYVIKNDITDPTEFSWLQLTILNTGTGSLTWKIYSPDSWIYTGINPSTLNYTSENEFAILNIGVYRNILTPGNYTGLVEITTSKTVAIPVYLTVY